MSASPDGFWLADEPLVLASGSWARARLLSAAGIPITIDKPDLDERAIEAPLLAAGAGGGKAASARVATRPSHESSRWKAFFGRTSPAAGRHAPAQRSAAAPRRADGTGGFDPMVREHVGSFQAGNATMRRLLAPGAGA